MISHVSYIMTLANSIIGVSVLAMPFCFKQCGVILAIIVLLLSSLLSRLACHFLIKSAVMSRRRNFEFLAFHAFGQMGKFLVELFIIGFLLGTCIAFYVVIGDLGPQIIGKMLNKNPDDIRISFLLTTGALIVLPLGLLRNIDSLATICVATIGFYLCLVLKVMTETVDHMFRGDWYDSVNYWRPAGILQCLPIFSMALFCQTQLFEIYESIPNVSLEKMDFVVKGALNICTVVYLCVGFFGYIAFCNERFSGNILLVLEPSLTSDVIKIGFVLSVIFSFPLVIFPCRASLNSLLFHQGYTHEQANNYIPQIRFRCLTFIIVTVSLITGIMMPNIEFVLGLVGSTIGVMICLIFPAGFFIVINTKNTNERLVAQVILFIGIWIMILGTYANLYAMEESSTTRITVSTEKPIINMNNLQSDIINNHDNMLLREPDLAPIIQSVKIDMLETKLNLNEEKNSDLIDARREPPVPVERRLVTEKVLIQSQKASDPITLSTNNNERIKIPEKPILEEGTIDSQKDRRQIIEEKPKQHQKANKILINSEKTAPAKVNDNKINAESHGKMEPEQFLKKLEEHREETRKLIEEQKEILKDIKQQKEELEMEKKQRLMESIKLIEIDRNVKLKSKELIEEKNNSFHDKASQQIQNDVKMISLESHDTRKAEKLVEPGAKSVDARVNSNNTTGNPINLNNYDENLKNLHGNSLNGSLMDSQSPILNILTNWTTTRNSSYSQKIITQIKLEDFRKADRQNIPKSIQYELPILLKLINQTKEKTQNDPINKIIEEVPFNRQDILENQSREKREIELEENLIEDKESRPDREIVINETVTDNKFTKIKHCTDSSVKSYADLEQLKIDDKRLLKSDNIDVEYQIIKKRDLKTLK